MAFQPRGKREIRATEAEVVGSLCRLGSASMDNETVRREHERRIRREIANSNERRRMQSINAGFQSLKTLIPHSDGEKLSKAAILQQTAEYIFALEQDKTRLLHQNSQLKRALSELMEGKGGSPSPKRKKMDSESRVSDEGIADVADDHENMENIKKQMLDLRCQLDKERRLRMMLEEQNRSLEAQLYPERLRELAHQVQIQAQQDVHRRIVEQQHQLIPQQVQVQIQPQPTPVITVPVSAMTTVSQDAVTASRQSLDTIVQAIQHLEGNKVLQDHTKQDDESSIDPDSEPEREEVVMTTEVATQATEEEVLASTGSPVRVELVHHADIVNQGELVRQLSQQELTSRPGVIIS
ncbi:transcription factor AP-4-like isoform X1 [Branchiostoma floridae]|uniref:Transcription factor AP-4-like isoform X1 n=2 Tax=Branchiostoma floridae TaxID=7739 RepID=A0A9J7LDZ6_BRAFL|nr:transcription factor AP-4-like isoform X1 [Branchiostoma floridae]